jgi:putative heme-binding domain-containing protein
MRNTLRIGALLMALAFARLPAAELVNPYEGDDLARRAGSSLYANRCADCHGPDARGKLGPDLTQRFAAGVTDEAVFLAMRRGVAGSIMPPSVAPDNELWAVVTYLRGISVAPPLVSTGDAARGRERFTADCARCHRVGNEGGVLGPDLTRVGVQRSRAALIAALREPGTAVPIGFKTATLRTRGGDRVEGVVKSEDAFSVQLLTADGRLRAFAKRELAVFETSRVSPMPAFAPGDLDEAALEDLLAYLGSLRGVSP